MHISDGILSLPVVVVTSAAAVGVVGYSLKKTKPDDIPKIALMAATFFVGSLIHFNIGVSSVHLLLSGIIGLMLGASAPIAISVALLLQLLLLQFGGLSSLGANILDVSIPAMLFGFVVRPRLGKSPRLDFTYGAIAGGGSVICTIVLVALMLIESNLRFGFGPFSAIKGLMIAHIPVMLIEAIVTGFAVRMIIKVRPEMIQTPKQTKESEDEKSNC